MNIKSLSSLAVACILSLGSINATDFWIQDFNSGMPKSFTILDQDGIALASDFYNNVSTSNGWVTARTAENGFSALSLSHTNDENGANQENWLITNQIELTSDNPHLRWEAKSIYSHRPESYRVMISDTDTELSSFEEIAFIEGEAEYWNTHIESLKEYEGKKIYLAFVCVSNNKFILAIDNIAVGQINDEKLVINDRTQRFCGDVDAININGSIINAGKSYDLKNLLITATVTDGESETFTIPVNRLFSINDCLDYSVDAKVEVGKHTDYLISGECTDGTIVDFHSDYVICSYFKRKMMVEKGTGAWCNNCPDGSVYMHELQHRYGDELIYAGVHVRDMMESNFQSGISQWLTQVPIIVINRIDGSGVLSLSDFKKSNKFIYDNFHTLADRPTYVGITATANKSESTIEINSEVEFATQLDNSQDIYRIGYGLIEKSVNVPNNSGYIQNNGCTYSPTSQEYYYMPTSIPSSLMTYDNVTREGATSKDGVKNSFDATIPAGYKKSLSYSLPIPSTVINPDNLSVIAFVMDISTGEILNAEQIDLSESSDVEKFDYVNSDFRLSIAGKECYMNSSDINPYSLQVISVDGKVLKSICNIPAEQKVVSLGGINGFVIITATQNGITKSVKAIL